MAITSKETTSPWPLVLIVAVVLSLTMSVMVSAAPADLDASFGKGGIVNTGFDVPPQALSAVANGVVVQPDGKIVTVGNFSGSGVGRIVLVRYNSDGSLDTSFGFAGKVLTTFEFQTSAIGVVIQRDGRIVVAGAAFVNMDHSEFLTARFEANGEVDASFGTAGAVLVNIGGTNVHVSDIALQADGKIVLVGDSDDCTFAIVRLHPGGSLDTSFDGDGKLVANIGAGYATKAALQQDGKIVIAGSLAGHSFVARYNQNGSPDLTFDGDGIVSTSLGEYDYFGAIAVQPDGKIVAAGAGSPDDEAVFVSVVRYKESGELDTSFDADGIITTYHPDCNGFHDLAIQSNGKILVLGSSGSIVATSTLVRYHADGAIDLAFGNGGSRTDQFGYSSYFGAIVLQADGRIVAAGYRVATVFSSYNILVARYLGDAVIPVAKRFDFDGDGRDDLSVFRSSTGTWYLDRSSQGFASAQFGLPTDTIVPADFDGDAKTDIAVFRDGIWWIIRSSDGSIAPHQFGQAGDIPAPADFTGDGRDELAVYRNGEWWSLNLVNGQTNLIRFGLATDKPVAADYDSDGRADQAVYRNGAWHLNRSTQGYTVVQFGLAADRPVVGDYDGDRTTDLAVYRDGTWYALQSSGGFSASQFGSATDIPTPADYDGDGRTDIAVFRAGTWYVMRSTGGVLIQQFGLTDDRPLPSAYVR